MKETLWSAVLASMVRKGMTVLATWLITYGWITQDIGDRLTSEGVTLISAGLVTLLASVYMSYRNVIWEWVKTYVAKFLPPSATMKDVAEIAHTVNDKGAVARGMVDIDPSDLLPQTKGKGR